MLPPHSGQEPHVAWGRSAVAHVNPLRGAPSGARGPYSLTLVLLGHECGPEWALTQVLTMT